MLDFNQLLDASLNLTIGMILGLWISRFVIWLFVREKANFSILAAHFFVTLLFFFLLFLKGLVWVLEQP